MAVPAITTTILTQLAEHSFTVHIGIPSCIDISEQDILGPYT